MCAAVEMPGAPANRLNQRTRRPQESFFVRVQNRHQRNFRQIQSLAQQIDADQYIELALAQIAQNLHPLQCLDFRMHVAALHADFGVVFGQILRHALGQRRDQHTLAFSTRARISCSRSSICPFTGRISTGGSISPVGRIICSTTTPADFVSSYGPGVAET